MGKNHNITVTGKVGSTLISWEDEEMQTFHAVIIEEDFDFMGGEGIQPWSLILPGEMVTDPATLSVYGTTLEITKSTLYSMHVTEMGIIPVLEVSAFTVRFDPS